MQTATQKYTVNQHPIEVILAWVKAEEIAIPEIQRPFVWDSTKVRDLMDSLYTGMESDFSDLNMAAHGIPRETYEAILQQLRSDTPPTNDHA